MTRWQIIFCDVLLYTTGAFIFATGLYAFISGDHDVTF